MKLGRQTHHQTHRPPPLNNDSCDICGQPVNTEITWYFRPSPLTGARTTHSLCNQHGRQAHNAIAHLLGFNHIEEPVA
jgi:hypothetical protein